MSNLKVSASKYTDLINNALLSYLPKVKNGQDIVVEVMKYSLMNGGKRIRPVLTLEFCNICGGDVCSALPFACAVEMIHSYSLIHDDLPCMDDDDMRRGKPSCHIKFGEAYALLAGDGLLNLAFETMLNKYDKEKVSAETAVKAAAVLSDAAGCKGMIGGQVIDLLSEDRHADIDRLKVMDSLKTGAMIAAACKIGCIVAGADEKYIKAAEEYASYIGLAFQIVDDILDVTGDAEKLGKPVGSDIENGKSTYVSLLGLEASKNSVNELTEKAKQSLNVFNGKADVLISFADKLAARQN